MNGVFPDSYLGNMLDAWVTGVGSLRAHLGQNNVTITRATVAADISEAVFSGYASQVLSGPGAPVYDPVNHKWSVTYNPITWQNTTGIQGCNVYCVYFTDGSGVLVYAEEVSGGPSVPVDMNTSGKTYIYTPIIEMLSEFSTSP